MAVCALAALSACGKRVPEPPGMAPGTPHLAWIIMHGDRDNPDAEFACQSTGPTDCVVPASRPDALVFSDVHLYHHGAGSQTTFVGSYELGYFQRSDGAAGDLDHNDRARGREECEPERHGHCDQHTRNLLCTVPPRGVDAGHRGEGTGLRGGAGHRTAVIPP